MDQSYVLSAVEELRQHGIGFEPGLSEREVEAVESRFHFRFPPDLRQFLQVALPVSMPPEPDDPDVFVTHSDPFPNWRSADEASLRERLDWPAEGICFDIRHNGFWHEPWGPRPASDDAACGLAREQVRQAPTLIPVFGHRYLPDLPQRAGNPVFSVWQTDIIYYGFDLPHYLTQEFQITSPYPEPSQPRRIAFWSSLPYLWNPAWD